ncbi:MAG: ATP-dependent DNA helicase RecG [Clostridiales bacterium]|nr:ATP-dependent DNA helicase RecG [Clostridiales bacterium]
MRSGDADIRSLCGVGEQRARALARLGIRTVGDLMYFFPKDYIALRDIPPVHKASHGEKTSLVGTVVSAVRVNRPRPGFSVSTAAVDGDRGRAECVWFNKPYLKTTLRQGSRWLFIGTLDTRMGALRILNPVMESLDDGAPAPILPQYRLARGLTQKALRALVRQGLTRAARETLPPSFRKRYELAERGFALENIHFPVNAEALGFARRRLAFEELLMYVIALRSQREMRAGGSGVVMRVLDEELTRFTDGLPFPLTGAQRRVLREIARDMASPAAMNRLVQGDVGSGKTVLAMAALYIAARSGMQGALMAPTEILAEQHRRTAEALLVPHGIRVGMLTGGMRAAERRVALAALAEGAWDVVIGTHALIQPGVVYRSLGIVITDEQHRFGVAQRAALGEKGARPDMLVMSATPIPRTLALILYGDLDISLVDELPPGRRPVITRIVPGRKRDDMYRYIAERLVAGEQAYIICPLVEDSEKVDSLSATGLYEELVRGALRNVSVGLLHGRMAASDKEALLARFRLGEMRALVATTVVEVGVDVPAASIIVVENADRFGLAQLHQLRGRVGRGQTQSWCFLAPGEAGEDAMRRLSVMAATCDGFAIAQKDLEMRGPGEFLGQQQAGMTDPRVLALLRDVRILAEVREAADRLFEAGADPAEREAILTEALGAYEERMRGIVFN